MLFVVLCPGTPEGSTGSGSGFKASQKTGQRLKVSSDRLGEAGNRTCDPCVYPLHLFVAFLGINQFRRVGLRYVCWFYVGNTQRLTGSGFMEKQGIEPATPGLQGITLIHYTTAASYGRTDLGDYNIPFGEMNGRTGALKISPSLFKKNVGIKR